MTVHPQSDQLQPTSDSHGAGSSNSVRPVTESATVINPERRGRPPEGEGSSVFPRSSIWNRLFPPDSEYFESHGHSWAGLELGHFVIEERIGVGGMGAVFRAMDNRLQRVVALKVLSPAQSRDPSAVQRFRNEARAAARLDHDNIARVYYIGEDDGLHFIAFEYVIGTNVRDLIRQRGQLDPEDAVNFALQIAAALKHTSANGVVHRDIKPSNIIITPAGRAKLVDLGLARKEHTESVSDLTMAGTTLGTFDYISPEQAKDPREVDVRSDIYSLGCTIYHMLTGEPPYPEGTVLQKLLDHQGKEPPNPALKNRRVSDDIAAIVRKMMASDPKRRYATPDLLIHDLMLVAGTLGLRGMNPEGLVWMSSRPAKMRFWERHIGWMATAASLLVFVAVLQLFPSILDLVSFPVEGTNQQAASTQTPGLAPVEGDQERQTPAHAPAVKGDSSASAAIAGDVAAGDPREALLLGHAAESPEMPADPRVTEAPLTSEAGLNITKGLPRKTPTEPLPFDDPDLRSITMRPVVEFASPEPPPVPTTVAGEKDTVVAEASPAPAVSRDSTAPETIAPLPEDSRPIAVLVNGTTVKRYRTLEAACSEAEDGSVIELRFNGLSPEGPEGPLRISRRLTIRAAEGYRPLIAFQPVIDLTEDFPRMITVTGGELYLINVGLRLVVPTDLYADGLALFSLQRPEWIRLEGVTVDVVNPEQYPPTVVLELTRDPSQTTSDMRMMQGTQEPSPTNLVIKRSFIRGDCDVLAVRESEPARVEMTNSAIAIGGSLVRLDGSDSMAKDGDRLEFRLEHLTCALGGSLLTLDSEEFREFLPIQITAQNNIFAARDSNGALLRMLGEKDRRELQQLVTWKGDTNFYSRYVAFWEFSIPEDTLLFEAWKSHWGSDEVGTHAEGVNWALPWWETDLGKTKVDDLALGSGSLSDSAPGSRISAVRGASDGTDAGANLSLLPRIPPIIPGRPAE